jgi:hypothetical protein
MGFKQGLIRVSPRHQPAPPPGKFEGPEGGPRWPNHLVLTGAVKKTGAPKVADRPLDRVELGELPCSASGHFPNKLVLRERRWMEFQDEPKNRRLLAIVLVRGKQWRTHPSRP